MEQIMKKYTVEYFIENVLEIYPFVCLANDIQHAIEQCKNAYPNCSVVSVSMVKGKTNG